MLRAIVALFEGLFTVFKHLFKKPVTLEYPEKKKELNDFFRGKPVVAKGCIGCGICEKVCPSSAIHTERDEAGKCVDIKIDLKKCIFCGNCAYYCSKGIIKMSKDYELGTDNIADLDLEYKVGDVDND